MAIAKTEHLLRIDGQKFDVRLTKVERSANILDRFARRNTAGGLIRKVIGTYYNYSLEFAYNDAASRYDILWKKLTEPVEFHDILIVDSINTINFTGYIANVKDKIIYADPFDGSKRIFEGLSCDLIARFPYRIPN